MRADVGFDIPNKFIVGCNMDYNEYFRELNVNIIIMTEIQLLSINCLLNV